MSELALLLENSEIKLDFTLSGEGRCRITDRVSGEIWEAPDLGVIRAWDRTEDRMRVQVLVPDADKAIALEVKRQSTTSAIIHVNAGGSGNASAMGGIQLGVQFDIDIQLKGNAVEVAIPEESFKENRLDRYETFSIELLPNLGATPKGSPGYLFIPCWSGGVYYFDRKNPRVNPNLNNTKYVAPDTEEGIRLRHGLQADDPAEYGSLIYGVQASWEDQIELPIYATVRQDAALVGLVIGGAYDTEIIAKRDQGERHLASAHSRFHYRYEWLSKRDTESRCIRFVLLRGKEASYSGIANMYRDYLLNECGVPTLEERIAKNESLAYFRDSINVRIMFGMTHNKIATRYIGFAELASSMPMFKEAGFDKVSFTGVGANLGGHDWAHPTIFPFEPAYGGEEEMKQLLKAIADHGYRMGLHTNYKDVYRHSADWKDDAVQRNEWGEFRYHGAWMGGYSYQGIPHKMLEYYVKRDLPKLKAMGFNGYWYFDAVGSVMEETFPPGEPICRREYGEGLNAYLSEGDRLFGCCGNELSIATSLGILANTNVSYLGGGGPVNPNYGGYARNGLLDHGVPFQHMVYHGLCFYGGGAELAGRVGMEFSRAIKKEEVETLFKRWEQHLEWRGDLDFAFFVDHSEEEPGITKSVFSDGTVIYANKTDKDWNQGGVAVPAKGHRIIREKA